MAVNKKKNTKSINIPKIVTDKIPYINVYKEEGMIETSPGIFTKSYFIEDINVDNIKTYDSIVVVNAFSKLLNELPANMNLQFTIHNKLISQEVFLKKILRVPDKEEIINEQITKYNKTLMENSMIGHNNIKKSKYFTISTKADTPDDAVLMFASVDKKIKVLFENIYGIKVGGLSTVSRLQILYSMFNPKGNDFGKKADLRGDGNFNFEDIKKLKLTTKDCIAPQISFDTSKKTYITLNNDTYVRSFFIVNMPVSISANLFSDITNISSNMIFSATYEPMDSKYSFEVATQNIAANTIVKQNSKRDTIADRRNKTIIKTETLIHENEQAYFEKEALKTVQEAVAVNEKTMLCSFVISLYSDDLDILDRDTKLLHLSLSKFACQIKALDLQQLQGFQSVLPLCQTKVDIKRTFTVSKLATVSPLNIDEVLQKDGLFCGLNTINDNLILLNRKNNPILAGMIAGTEHSGKTFQNKREILNTMISTKDQINILASTDEYDNFVTKLGGVIIDKPFCVNPFAMMDHYGMLSPDMYSKSLMLEAFLASLTKSKEKAINLNPVALLNEEIEDTVDPISEEIQRFCQNSVDLNNPRDILLFIRDNTEDYPLLTSKFSEIKAYLEKEQLPTINSRLVLYKFTNLTDRIVYLDYLWNKQISLKMQNTTVWLFIDSIDDFLLADQSALFLNDYVNKMNALQNVLTIVIQNSVKLFSDGVITYRLENLITLLGYYKLLNQGAIERKKYMEILNIPNTLANYITATGLGKGIILTSATNVPFNDSFFEECLENGTETKSKKFYDLFKI